MKACLEDGVSSQQYEIQMIINRLKPYKDFMEEQTLLSRQYLLGK